MATWARNCSAPIRSVRSVRRPAAWLAVRLAVGGVEQPASHDDDLELEVVRRVAEMVDDVLDEQESRGHLDDHRLPVGGIGVGQLRRSQGDRIEQLDQGALPRSRVRSLKSADPLGNTALVALATHVPPHARRGFPEISRMAVEERRLQEVGIKLERCRRSSGAEQGLELVELLDLLDARVSARRVGRANTARRATAHRHSSPPPRPSRGCENRGDCTRPYGSDSHSASCPRSVFNESMSAPAAHRCARSGRWVEGPGGASTVWRMSLRPTSMRRAARRASRAESEHARPAGTPCALLHRPRVRAQAKGRRDEGRRGSLRRPQSCRAAPRCLDRPETAAAARRHAPRASSPTKFPSATITAWSITPIAAGVGRAPPMLLKLFSIASHNSVAPFRPTMRSAPLTCAGQQGLLQHGVVLGRSGKSRDRFLNQRQRLPST